MSEAQGIIPMPNRLVHEPARLAILTALSACASSDFLFLQTVTGLSKGNLSVQLTNLEQAGLIVIEKRIIDKKTRTTVRLSKNGKAEMDAYWKTMDEIRARMKADKKHHSLATPRLAPLRGLTPETAR